ncbi:hypothetical protein SeLEV6574_g06806 [Synchytrium endobioticum]|nr:hypothetical protein SeLEV6574_g06812 [Synchytrium endobioticum]TPX40065.1 hypothetical protein SeLEV6574_g06806 [Synchytrium endobioticum]
MLILWNQRDESHQTDLDELTQERPSGSKSEPSKLEDPPKHLTCIFGMWTGMANNIISIQTSLVFAMRYNRTLIVPPLDNWDVTPSYWFSKSENVSDTSGLNRELINVNWGSEAFQDPYRRFSKYFHFESPSVTTIDMSDLAPNTTVKQSLRDSNNALLNNGKMWCWRSAGYDRDYPETMEEKYPITKWDQDDLVCIGVPFEILLHDARPRLKLTEWAVQQAAALLDLNGLKGKRYLGIHLRRGNWDEYTTHGRFALSTFAKGSLKGDSVERRAPRDEHVIKAGEILRRRLEGLHDYKISNFPVVVTTNEQNNSSIQRFEDAGWIVVKKRLPNLPDFAQIALDLAILVGATGFLGQYASTFTLLAINMRGCDVEAPEFPCGLYFGSSEIV